MPTGKPGAKQGAAPRLKACKRFRIAMFVQVGRNQVIDVAVATSGLARSTQAVRLGIALVLLVNESMRCPGGLVALSLHGSFLHQLLVV